MSEDRLAPGMTVGRFILDRKLGTGGYGTVWRARDAEARGSLVALKVLHQRFADSPRVVERFTREADLLHRLEHPNIVRPLAFNAEAQRPYLAMELVDGVTLDEAIRECSRASTPMSPSEVSQIFAELCGAIAYAHSLGIVHRDLKPQNVMLVRHGKEVSVKIMDFGIAKILEETGEGSTTVGRKVGSVRYMSPEQALGQPVTAKSDLFALGVILYEMTTLRRPWIIDVDGQPASAHCPKVRMQDNSISKVYERITTAPRPRPSAVRPEASRELDEVVVRATAIRAEDRYLDVRELGAAARDPLLGLAPTRGLSVLELHPVEGARELDELDQSLEARDQVPTRTVTQEAPARASADDARASALERAADSLRDHRPRHFRGASWWLATAIGAAAVGGGLLLRRTTQPTEPSPATEEAPAKVAPVSAVELPTRTASAGLTARVAPPSLPEPQGLKEKPAAKPIRAPRPARPRAGASSASRGSGRSPEAPADRDLAGVRALLTRVKAAPEDGEAAALLAARLEALSKRVPEAQRATFTKRVRVSAGMGDVSGLEEALRTLEQLAP
ncbi:MAG: serine/threonine protein kinase [Deltaproteobacteria bacterium]|nr:serine/threonine protein kinase [Deltaproteobacteria bacterium]